MTIHISVYDLEPKIRKLYLQKQITQLGIDYAPNSIMGWCDNKEIEVFNFSKICRMDNRWSSYEIHQNITEIIIEITNL
jgi:hypothetical protein